MSVNGRPFRPDPTSYLLTGIPCGNPARYKSRAVIRTTRSAVPFEDQQVGIPGKGTVSQAELELKKLLQKQLDPSHPPDARRMNFTTASKIDTFGKATAGIKTLSQFKEIETLQKRSQELQDLRLSPWQVRLQLQHEGYTSLMRREEDMENMKESDDMMGIEKGETEPVGNQSLRKRVKRDEVELRYEGDGDDEEQGVLMVLKEGTKGEVRKEEEDVKGKEEDKEEEGEEKKEKDKKKRKFANPEFLRKELTNIQEEMETHTKNSLHHPSSPIPFGRHAREVEASILQGKRHLPLAHLFLDSSSSSSSSVTTTTSLTSLPWSETTSTTSTNATTTKQTTSEPKPLEPEPEPLSLSEIESNRMCAEELLKRFPKYSEGQPSNIIYVKNLARTSSEPDLLRVFGSFEQESTVGRLSRSKVKRLTGRMREQAFIEFSSVECALSALTAVNGYLLKGKPLIVSFGKRCSLA